MHKLFSVSTVLIWVIIGFAFSVAKAADTNALNEALDSLRSHVSDEISLSPEQLSAQLKLLNTNAEAIAENRDSIESAIDFISAYDAKYQPLFIGHKQLHQKNKGGDDTIHWAAFWTMQHLFDQVYNNERLNQYGYLVGSLKFATADYFPGKVDAPINPGAYTVKINGSYPETWGSPQFHGDRPARKPTGAYLVPGTVAKVTVPYSLVGKGYQIRVGAHSWDLEEKPRVNRLFRVSALYAIDSREIYCANPLGGGIYIEVPPGSHAGVVEVSIKNAARAPYFSWKHFHKTTLQEWLNVERHHKAPWADFQSDKFMTQVPTSWIYKMEDPITYMEDWDLSMDVMNDLIGRPHLFGRETVYTQVDTQLRGRAYHPGYPGGNAGYNPNKDYGGKHTHHLVRGPRRAHSYEFHEKGHAKYVDMARLFGWDMLARFWQSTNRDYMEGNAWLRNNQKDDSDRYTLRLSEIAGADLRPLLHFWGIPPHDADKLKRDIQDARIKSSRKVYDTLLRYKSLIPEDRAAFREYARAWWDKEPSEKGYTTERNHAAYWDAYDRQVAEEVHLTLHEIFERYFPDGRPKM